MYQKFNYRTNDSNMKGLIFMRGGVRKRGKTLSIIILKISMMMAQEKSGESWRRHPTTEAEAVFTKKLYQYIDFETGQYFFRYG